MTVKEVNLKELNLKEVTLPTQYQQFIHQSRYARWREDVGRRETWQETVDRYVEYMVADLVEPDLKAEIRTAILKLDILPSMRAMMSAGEALDRCNVAGYNCAYTPIDKPIRFSEILYILLCGTGVGFSVEYDQLDGLPKVPEVLDYTETWTVGDSKEGWAEAYRHLIDCLFKGAIPSFDYKLVRPSGARLKTFGGRASGPGPLADLFNFTIKIFRMAQGRRLLPIEIHDIVCKVGEVVVVGGVRRSALISLSDLSDKKMSEAKAGKWWEGAPHRALANNSAVYNSTPSVGDFMKEWSSIYHSGSGERGIFSRAACEMIAKKHNRDLKGEKVGTNPCSEIILRPQQFCNLTEVVVRAGDGFNQLNRKVYLATVLGTLQARKVDFRFLSPEWRKTTEEDALLGVSMTGIYDAPDMDMMGLIMLRDNATETNREFAKAIGINKAAAITCVKPSGTVSQLADCASGIHQRHSAYYIRRVRGDVKDPLTLFLVAQGVKWEPCVMKPDTTVVFSFPQRAPEGTRLRNDVTAIDHLKKWLHYQKFWCHHKPSVTISVLENEWPEVGGWVYKNFEWMSGVSFLPHSDHTYKQAPYEECDEDTYRGMVDAMPHIDWSTLSEFEHEDNTNGMQTLACSSGACEIVDIT